MSDYHGYVDGRMRADSVEIAFRKIFIGGLSYSTDEEKLKRYFKSYGAVQDAVVMKDPVSKRSRGFGFITFCDVGAVDVVLANEPHTVDGRKVEAKRAVPRSEMMKEVDRRMSGSGSMLPPPPHSSSASGTPVTTMHKTSSPGTPMSSPLVQGKSYHVSSTPSGALFDSRSALDPKINSEEYAYNKIFVGGLHYDTRDPEFRSYFEKYGKVISAEVMFNRETHKSRGFGFIVFEFEDSAIQVCAEKEHVINGKAVEVKRAIPRSKMNTPVSSGTSTPVSASSSSSLAKFPTSSMNADVRARSKSELPLSGNSSTLAMMSFGNSPAVSAHSKLNAPLGTAGNALRTPSYAAALKNGSALNNSSSDILTHMLSPQNFESLNHNSQHVNSSAQKQGSPATSSPLRSNTASSPSAHSPPLFPTSSPSSVIFPQVGNENGSSFETLLPRTSRAFSEPIVRLEPLIDFSSFNSRAELSSNSPARNNNWLDGSPSLLKGPLGIAGDGGSAPVAGGPPSPEAWARFISTLSANGENNSNGSMNGSGSGNGSSSKGSTSPGLYSLLQSEAALWSTGGTTTGASSSLSLFGESLSHSNNTGGGDILGNSRTRSRTVSRDESGSLVLGIARNSRANSLADLDMSLSTQRRFSHPHEMLDTALSQLSQLTFEGESESSSPMAKASEPWR